MKKIFGEEKFMMVDDSAYRQDFQSAFRAIALGYKEPQIKVIQTPMMTDDKIVQVGDTLLVRSLCYFTIQHWGYKMAFNHFKLSDEVLEEAVRFAQYKLSIFIEKL
jgi:hypothetical protein